MYRYFLKTYVMCISVQGGLSALMLCCEEGNLEIAELLLDAQAEPDLQQPVC